MESVFGYAVSIRRAGQCVLSGRAMRVRDLVKQLEENGWKLDRTKGSHRQYRNSERPELRTITVAGHMSEDVPRGTLAAILKQAGLKK
jgi:predicted RNA binding protein YcfA (HicA-like mRNA interferase family)